MSLGLKCSSVWEAQCIQRSNFTWNWKEQLMAWSGKLQLYKRKITVESFGTRRKESCYNKLLCKKTCSGLLCRTSCEKYCEKYLIVRSHYSPMLCPVPTAFQNSCRLAEGLDNCCKKCSLTLFCFDCVLHFN